MVNKLKRELGMGTTTETVVYQTDGFFFLAFGPHGSVWKNKYWFFMPNTTNIYVHMNMFRISIVLSQRHSPFGNSLLSKS